jgi:hypothetical protein
MPAPCQCRARPATPLLMPPGAALGRGDAVARGNFCRHLPEQVFQQHADARAVRPQRACRVGAALMKSWRMAGHPLAQAATRPTRGSGSSKLIAACAYQAGAGWHFYPVITGQCQARSPAAPIHAGKAGCLRPFSTPASVAMAHGLRRVAPRLRRLRGSRCLLVSAKAAADHPTLGLVAAAAGAGNRAQRQGRAGIRRLLHSGGPNCRTIPA